jgi:hypothetical protein
MAVYMIGYDLVKPDHDYAPLYKALNEFSTSLHCLDSTWFIVSDQTAQEILNGLLVHVHPKHDRLIVTPLTVGSAWTVGLGKESSDWLHRHLPKK